MSQNVIKNRKNQKIVALVDEVKDQKGLAFVMHGLGGFKEQPHIQTITDALLENGYTVVRFDTTNTFGESDGDYEDATTTNYYEDLEDVIKWAGTQKWHQEPFVLAGHSLGGICVALFAENFPEKVRAVAPISTVVSGELSLTTLYERGIYEKWRETGWREEKSMSKPGVIKRLKWSHAEDRVKYDLLKKVNKLMMPVLLIVGENDTGTPPEHQKILYDTLPGEKELHIIKGAPHTFRNPVHLAEIKQIFNRWLNEI